jgi:hypothetical protein
VGSSPESELVTNFGEEISQTPGYVNCSSLEDWPCTILETKETEELGGQTAVVEKAVLRVAGRAAEKRRVT